MQKFEELDNGTLFMCQYSWLHEDDTTGQRQARSSVGVWPWEVVKTVQTMDEHTFKEMQGERCTLLAADGWIYLHASFAEVLAAWRRYRLSAGAIRFASSN